MSELHEIKGLQGMRPLVHEAVNVLEVLYASEAERSADEPWARSANWWRGDTNQAAAEVRELMKSPLRVPFLNFSVRLFHELVRHGRPTLYLCRQLSPEASVLFHLCSGGRAFPERIVQGDIQEEDFPRLTVTAGQLAGAPMWICDARKPEAFLRVLFEARPAFNHVVCDWGLSEEEWATVGRMPTGGTMQVIDLGNAGPEPQTELGSE